MAIKVMNWNGWRPIADLPQGEVVVGGFEAEKGFGLIADTLIHRRPDRLVYGVRSTIPCKATHYFDGLTMPEYEVDPE